MEKLQGSRTKAKASTDPTLEVMTHEVEARPILERMGISDSDKVLRVYRCKIYGKEKMYAVCSDKTTPSGITIIPTYRKYKVMVEQQDGSQIPEERTDETMITARTKRFDIDYNKDDFKTLVDRCVNDSPMPQILFKEGNKTITIREEKNLYAKFDDIMRLGRKGESV